MSIGFHSVLRACSFPEERNAKSLERTLSLNGVNAEEFYIFCLYHSHPISDGCTIAASIMAGERWRFSIPCIVICVQRVEREDGVHQELPCISGKVKVDFFDVSCRDKPFMCALAVHTSKCFGVWPPSTPDARLSVLAWLLATSGVSGFRVWYAIAERGKIHFC